MRRTTLSCLVLLLVGGCAGYVDEDGTAVASDELGRGTELVYENCYEHVAAFRVPITTLSALVGQPLPTGYAYRTFDPARTIGQLVASAVECDQGGHTVTDVWVHVVVLPPPGSVLRQLRVRHYTSSPQTRARFGLFCFGDVTGTGEVRIDGKTVSKCKIADPATVRLAIRSGLVSSDE